MSSESIGTTNGKSQLTGRQLIMIRLGKLVAHSKVSDIHRACDFLEWAIDVRRGCRQQRTRSRAAQNRRRFD